MTPIAALYVQTGGSYFNLEGVQPWDEESDARMYGGPFPVVAHPPCQRWGSYGPGSRCGSSAPGSESARAMMPDVSRRHCPTPGAGAALSNTLGEVTPGRSLTLRNRRARADGSRRMILAAGPAAWSKGTTATTPPSRPCCWSTGLPGKTCQNCAGVFARYAQMTSRQRLSKSTASITADALACWHSRAAGKTARRGS